MRALLIINPHATATTDRRRELLTRALAGRLDLRVVETTHRGHAATLAAEALDDDTRLLIAHGGDGTVNEVVNGLLTHGPNPRVPLLAVVPGGSTNVFARALGIDRDPTEATEQILESLDRGRTRLVSLGIAGNRYFTFNAGMGLDAEVVRAVEEHRSKGKSISNSLHIRRAIRQFFTTDRKNPAMTVTADGVETPDVFLTLVSNVDPWTYAGRQPVRTNPGLPADRGMGLLALRSLRLWTTVRLLRQLVARRRGPASKTIVRIDGTDQVHVRSERPLAVQLDGDYVGEFTEVSFRSIPKALRVVV